MYRGTPVGESAKEAWVFLTSLPHRLTLRGFRMLNDRANHSLTEIGWRNISRPSTSVVARPDLTRSGLQRLASYR